MHETKEQNQDQLSMVAEANNAEEMNASPSDTNIPGNAGDLGKNKKGKKIIPSKLVKPLAIVAIAVLLLGGISVLAYKNISLLVAAKVGNSFVTRKELNDKLLRTYGQAMLDQLVDERIISQGVAESGATFTQEEFDAKIADIESQVQTGTGMSLDAYLESRSLPREDFEKNIKMQLQLENMLAPTLKVEDDAVDTFIEEKGEYLTGETEEEKRAEAVEILLDQELGTAFQTWLEEQKTKVSVSTFLK